MNKLVFVLSLLLTTFAWGKPEISFEREVEVSAREKLTWADLASVKDGSDELFQELAQIPWKENSDMPTVLRERRLMTDLYSRLGVKLNLPSKVSVKTVRGYSSVEFRRKILNRLSSMCGECQFDLRSVHDEKVRLENNWSIDESAIKPTGSLLIPVNDSHSGAAWISVQLKIKRQALVLKRSVNLGQKILAEDVEMRETDVSNSKEVPVKMADLAQVAAIRGLSAGQAIFPSDLKRDELVKRGQMIKLLMGTDDFEVMLSATAEENGRMGDIVKVKNVESGKILSGQVSGAGQVRLQ